MALEALARVLEQAGRDYSDARREKFLHERDRAERLADEQRQLQNQKNWFDYTNQEGIKHEIARFSAMSDAQRAQEAMQFGVDPSGKTPQQLFEAITAAKLELNKRTITSDTLAKAKATVSAADQTFDQTQALGDRELADRRSAVWSQSQALQQELEAARKASGIPMPNASALQEQLAAPKVRSFFSQYPDEKSRKAALKEHGIISTQDNIDLAKLSSWDQANKLGLLDPTDEAEVKRNVQLQMTQAMRESGMDLSGLQQRMGAVERSALELGVDPYSSWENQNFAKRTKAAAPATPWFKAPPPPPPAPAAPQLPRIPSMLFSPEATLSDAVPAATSAEASATASAAAGAPLVGDFWSSPKAYGDVSLGPITVGKDSPVEPAARWFKYQFFTKPELINQRLRELKQKSDEEKATPAQQAPFFQAY